MSEFINNREYRRDVLKELISELHSGKTVDQVKQKFEETFAGVTASEISDVEQALIMDGMPVAEVQRLCDVHAAVFKGSIEQIHKPQDPSDALGHPVKIFKEENSAIEKLISERIKPNLKEFEDSASAESRAVLQQDMELLTKVEIHYQRKENLLFPYLEKYGITAPPKVMWGVDDEIRALVKSVKAGLQSGEEVAAVKSRAEEALNRITEMIFKEENILLPMTIDTLTEGEWKRIADESRDLGYCLLENVPDFKPIGKKAEEEPTQPKSEGTLILPSGVLKLEEIVKIFDTLPFDVTFVDKNDTVKYFSQGSERIFPRTKAIIGRAVQNCHPPASVHIVEKIVADFKSGVKDHEDFWIKMGNRFVFIRYFAVRNEAGEYMGTLEVTQDIAPIQAIEGEKRLTSE